MSTILSQVVDRAFQADIAADQVTTIAEAQQGQSADGDAAPEGTTAVVIEPGDTVSQVMADYGQNWDDEADREQFIRDNPQFGPEGDRNPDQIYPDEVIYIRDGAAQDAANATDAAAAEVERAEQTRDQYRKDPNAQGLEHEHEAAVQEAKEELGQAVQDEIEAGLDQYLRNNPDATSEQIEQEANRLGHQIQGRTGGSGIDDTTMDYHTQQATNHASAKRHGIDLGRVDPSTEIGDGPYTDAKGPFQPNASVQLTDGTYIKTDEHGWPDQDLNDDGSPDPGTAEEASTATDQAAQQLRREQNRDYGNPNLENAEKPIAVADARQRLGDAIQYEIELGLRDYIAANPDASEEEIQAESVRLGQAIQAREGKDGVISDSQMENSAEQAVGAVTRGK